MRTNTVNSAPGARRRALLFVEPVFGDLALSAAADVDHRATMAHWSERFDLCRIALNKLANVTRALKAQPLSDINVASAGLAFDLVKAISATLKARFCISASIGT